MARIARVVVTDLAHRVTQRGGGRQFILETGKGGELPRLSKSIKLRAVLAIFIVATGCTPDVHSKRPSERRQAVSLIHDQTVLYKIALDEEENQAVRLTAISNLTDPNLLAKIALNSDVSPFVCVHAYKKLATIGALDSQRLATDPIVSLRWSKLLMISTASQCIPAHRRSDLASQLLVELNLLNDPSVVAAIGSITKVDIKYNEKSESYYERINGRPFVARGEQLEVHFQSGKVYPAFQFIWASDFPTPLYLTGERGDLRLEDSWFPVLIDPHGYEVADKICRHLSESELDQIAEQGGRPNLRLAALEVLTNDDVISRVASEDRDLEVREKAIERLTAARAPDQTVSELKRKYETDKAAYDQKQQDLVREEWQDEKGQEAWAGLMVLGVAVVILVGFPLLVQLCYTVFGRKRGLR